MYVLCMSYVDISKYNYGVLKEIWQNEAYCITVFYWIKVNIQSIYNQIKILVNMSMR